MSRHRRSSPRPIAALAAAVMAAVLGSIGALAMRDSGNGPSQQAAEALSCPTSLQIVTASSFAPVVNRIAPLLESGPECVHLDISVADGRVAGQQMTEMAADVWIPDDTAWALASDAVDLAEKSAAGSGTVVATSPIYMIASASTGARVQEAGGGWRGLVNLVTSDSGVRLVVREPGSSGDGLVAIGALGEAVWLSDGMDASAEALATSLSATRTVTDQALPAEEGEVGLIAEYELLRLMQVAGGEVAKIIRESTILPASDHTAVLRYTWLPTATAARDPDRAQRLTRVLDALTGTRADDALAAVGLRRSDLSLPSAVTPRPPEPLAAPFDVFGPHQVDHVFATWYEEDRRSDILVAVDVSGSMAAVAPGSDAPLIKLVQQGIRTLAGLLPDSQLELWEFGVLLKPPRDHRTLLARGELDSPQRRRLASAVSGLTVSETGTGLYDTILAAYIAARDAYRQGVPNHVILFTDGRNEDDPNSISAKELRERLAAELDENRPVHFSIITFGPEPETDVLERALEPIDGYVDPLRTGDEVRAVFIHVAAGGVHN